MEIKTAYKVDRHRSDSWSGIYGYTPEDPGELKNYGEIYAVFSISAAIDYDLNNIAALLLDELQRSYFTEADVDTEIEHFEMALRMMRKHLEQILAREQELAETGIDLEGAVVVMKENVMFAGVIGESKIFVARGDEINEISGALIDPDLEGFMSTGSMLLEADDRIMLTTDAIAGGNSESRIVDALEKFDLVGIKENRGAALLLGYELVSQPEPEVAPVVAEAETADVTAEEFSEDVPVAPITPVSQAQSLVEEEPEVKRPVKRMTQTPEPGEPNQQIQAIKTKSKDMMDLGISYGRNIVNKAVDTTRNVEWSDLAANIARNARNAGNNLRRFVNQNVKKQPGSSRLSSGRVSIGNRSLERNQLVTLAGVIIVVIIIGTFINLNAQNQRREATEALQGRVDELTNEFEGQRAVAQLAESVNDRENIINSMADIEDQVEILRQEELLTEQMQAELDLIEGQIDETVNTALKIAGFTQPKIITDFAAEFEGANPTDIAFAGGKIYVTDSERGVVYSVSSGTDTQPEEVITGLNKPYLITADNAGDLVIIDRGMNGSALIKLNTDNNQATRQVGISNEVLGNLVDIDVWTNSALYALSDRRSAVVRMDRVGTDYAIPNYTSPWRRDDQFSNAIDFKVDFSIFMLIEGIGLQRYLGGEPAPINLNGLLPSDEQALNTANALDTSDRRVFIADSSGQRVFSFAKDLNDAARLAYEGQYQYQGDQDIFSNITEIIVNDNDSQIYVLDGTRLVRLDRTEF